MEAKYTYGLLCLHSGNFIDSTDDPAEAANWAAEENPNDLGVVAFNGEGQPFRFLDEKLAWVEADGS